MKRLCCLFCVVFLLMVTAVSAAATVISPEERSAAMNTGVSAENTGEVTAVDPETPVDDETMVLFGTDTMLETAAATEPATEPSYGTEYYAELGIMPLAGDAADNRMEIMVYAALGLSAFALLLAVIALAKSGKKNANAAGNYKKYF